MDESLSAKDVKKIVFNNIYANLIDIVVKDCQLLHWKLWSQNAFHLDAEWDMDAPDRIFKFRQKVMAAVWPHTLTELEKSIETVSLAMHLAVQIFSKHSKCDQSNNKYITCRFYDIDVYDEERYQQLLSEYKSWVQECNHYMYEVAKAINWFSDVVRRDINPNFFQLKGNF